MQRSPFRRSPAQLKVRAAADAPDVAELLIYDDIGFWGITAKDVALALKTVTADELHVRINSRGGDVFDGVAIHNLLAQHPAKVVVHIDGLAASIASVIALGGAEIHMAENAFFMIHEAWGGTIGTAKDHRKTADLLDGIGDVITDTYLKRADAERDQVKAWMDEETWFTAAQALEVGFVDEVTTTQTPKNRFDLSVFQHAPAALRDAAPAKASERDIERLLRDAGVSRSAAKAAVAALKQDPSLRDAAEADDHARVGSDLLRHLQTLTH